MAQYTRKYSVRYRGIRSWLSSVGDLTGKPLAVCYSAVLSHICSSVDRFLNRVRPRLCIASLSLTVVTSAPPMSTFVTYSVLC